MSTDKKNTKRTKLFAQLTGFCTIANSHRLPDATKKKILAAPDGMTKAIQVQVMEVKAFEEALLAALDGVEMTSEVSRALNQAVAEATQKITGKLRPSKKGNLTSNIAVSFEHLQPVLVEGSKEELAEGDLDEEMLARLMG
jgi:hypothetical protein